MVKTKKGNILLITGALILICLLILVILLANIYRNAEIVHCLYYNDGSDHYYDISIYGNGRITYTHGALYKFPLENSQPYIEKNNLQTDFITTELYYEKGDTFLSYQDHFKLLWTLIKLQFVDRVDKSGTSGMVDRADYIIYGEEFHTVPQSDGFYSDILAQELTEIIKKYCDIPKYHLPL